MQKTVTLSVTLLAGLLNAGAVMAEQQPETDDINEVPAGVYSLDALHSKVSWGVDHYGFSTYEGQFVDLSGELRLGDDPSSSQLTIEIPLNQVLTGSELSEHLKGEDFFNTAEHATATFKSTSIAMDGDNEATINGELTLNGYKHPLTIEAEFNQAAIYPYDEKYRLGFDGEATLKRSDYGIKYLLPEGDNKGVSDEVELDIAAEFVPEQAQ